ncbi:MAG: hypothetical protein KGJ08_04435 [Gammaproteobacteria bacterium]|nr:hypothetical protein [Gammaproteobacteria bacterium]
MHRISLIAHQHRFSVGCITAAGEHPNVIGPGANPYSIGAAGADDKLA